MRKPLRQAVTQWTEEQKSRAMDELYALYKKVVVLRINVPSGGRKRDLEKLELDILVDLEPRTRRVRALFWRVLCETKRGRGRPRKDQEAIWLQKQREAGRSYGEIAKGVSKEADRQRKLLDR